MFKRKKWINVTHAIPQEFFPCRKNFVFPRKMTMLQNMKKKMSILGLPAARVLLSVFMVFTVQSNQLKGEGDSLLSVFSSKMHPEGTHTHTQNELF